MAKTEKRTRKRMKSKNTHIVYGNWGHFFCSGEPFDPVPLLNNAVANIICQIVFGKRFDYSDHNFQSMLKNLTEMAYLEGSIWALVRCKEAQTQLTTAWLFIRGIRTSMLT